MNLWHTVFILVFIGLYGTVSAALLGSWAYGRVTLLRNTRRLRVARKKSKRGWEEPC